MYSLQDQRNDRGKDTLTLEQVGVEEVSVVPWTMMLPRKMARKVGLNRQWAMLMVVLSGLFATSFTITVIVVSLDVIATDLNSTVSALNWSLTGPMLAFGVVGPAFGKAGDLWGHKRVYVLGLAVAGVFAGLTALAWNAASMIAFRILSASAGAATGPAAMAYINRLFPPHERVRPLSMWSFTTAGAPVLGVVLGAPLVEAIGWRMIFIVQAPLCVIGVVLAARMLPETERMKNVKFDIAGSFTLGLAATSLLLAVNRGPAWGWASAPITGLFIVSVVALVVFVKVEQRADEPLMPMRWLRTRNVVLPITSTGLTNFAYMGGFLIVPQLLDKGLGLSAAHIGWLVIARPLTFSLVAPLGSSFTMKVGERVSAVLGAAFVVASMIMLANVRLGSSDFYVAIGLALSGVGLGFASPALTALVANSVDQANLGVAGAMQQLMSQLGAATGSTIMVSIHESTLDSGVAESYGFALYAGAAMAALGLAVSWFVRSTEHRETASD